MHRRRRISLSRCFIRSVVGLESATKVTPRVESPPQLDGEPGVVGEPAAKAAELPRFFGVQGGEC